MRRLIWPGVILLVAALLPPASAQAGNWLERTNRILAGRLVDYTNNHGVDRRIWSATLNQRRDLYVYLPPAYDPGCQYPVIVWLHGVFEDERSFVNYGALEVFDRAIVAGRLPPLIIVIPDGTVRGVPTLFGVNPLWANSLAGPFRDYLMNDIWPWARQHYPIRPEREAHVIAGFSGGGSGAFRIAIRFREEFGVCMGIHPALNVRWQDCRGRYLVPFDPDCWGWRNDVSRGREVVGRFYGGLIVIRLRTLVYPLYGRGPDAVPMLSENNPIEMIEKEHLQPGDLAMYVAYAGRDQFNITAQVDSFLYRARELGLPVEIGFEPKGTHSWYTGRRLLPGMLAWLGPRLMPYSLPLKGPEKTPCCSVHP